jgi:hypothetical protein
VEGFIFFGSIENIHGDDAPGASPRRYGTPVAMMLYYPDWYFPVIRRNRLRPRPHGGAGLAQGGVQIFGGKKVFSSAHFSKKKRGSPDSEAPEVSGLTLCIAGGGRDIRVQVPVFSPAGLNDHRKPVLECFHGRDPVY